MGFVRKTGRHSVKIPLLGTRQQAGSVRLFFFIALSVILIGCFFFRSVKVGSEPARMFRISTRGPILPACNEEKKNRVPITKGMTQIWT